MNIITILITIFQILFIFCFIDFIFPKIYFLSFFIIIIYLISNFLLYFESFYIQHKFLALILSGFILGLTVLTQIIISTVLCFLGLVFII